MRRSAAMVAAGAVIATIITAAGATAPAGAATNCDRQTTARHGPILYADPQFGATESPWVSLPTPPAGTVQKVTLDLTTFDETHTSHPKANAEQDGEQVVVDVEFTDGTVITDLGPTDDIADAATSAGPKRIFAADQGPAIARVRAVHFGTRGGKNQNHQSVHAFQWTIETCAEEEPEPPSLSVSKQVEGECTPAEEAEFTVAFDGPGDHDGEVTVRDGRSVSIPGARPGEYRFTETVAHGASEVTIEPNPAVVPDEGGAEVAVSVTNGFECESGTGSLAITKRVDGPSDPGDTWVVTYDGPGDADGQVEVAKDETVVVDHLPFGTYTLGEPGAPDGTFRIEPNPVTVSASQPRAEVVVTNSPTPVLGSVSLLKLAPTAPSEEFVFRLDGPNRRETQRVRHDERVTFDGLEIGGVYSLQELEADEWITEFQVQPADARRESDSLPPRTVLFEVLAEQPNIEIVASNTPEVVAEPAATVRIACAENTDDDPEFDAAIVEIGYDPDGSNLGTVGTVTRNGTVVRAVTFERGRTGSARVVVPLPEDIDETTVISTRFADLPPTATLELTRWVSVDGRRQLRTVSLDPASAAQVTMRRNDPANPTPPGCIPRTGAGIGFLTGLGSALLASGLGLVRFAEGRRRRRGLPPLPVLGVIDGWIDRLAVAIRA